MRKILIALLLLTFNGYSQTVVDVATGEYSIQYVKSDGTVWTTYMTSYDLAYAPTAIAGLTGITSADGGQYTSIFRKSDGTVYSSIGGQITSTAYPLDNTGAAFTCDKVYAMWRMGVALKNGEVWYWSLAQSNPEDMLLQFGSLATSVPAPRKLIQPSGKTITKIVHGAGLSPYTYAFLWGLASDGTLWQWDQTHTTPFQVVGKTGFPGTVWTGTVVDIGGNYDCRMVVTSTNQVWVWGSRAANYGGRSDWQNAAMDNIAANMTGAGIAFPLKQIAADYLCIQLLDNNDNKWGIGGNQVGGLGTGYMAPSWRTNWNGASNAVYSYDYEPYNGNQGAWVQQQGKWLNIKTNTSFVFYSYGQDMAGNWYSWGRAKAQVLGNGFTWKSADQNTYPDWGTIPSPRLVTPLTATWTVDGIVNPAQARTPIASAGINQYLTAGTTSTTLYGNSSHQNQPTNSTTVTMTNAWTRISGPNTPTITSPTSQNTTITGMIAGTYVFRNTVTNSVAATDYQNVTVIISPAVPRNYYVSGEGSDGAAGTVGAPWATVAHVNSQTFAANDSILFERGFTYYGGLIVNRSTINYGAYGSGTTPVISGLSTVSSWSSLGGNIYEASVTSVKAAVNLVLRNGVIQQIGRYPNANATNGGYLTLTAATSTSVTGPALSSVTNWTGSEIAIRVRRWDITRRTVTSHSGGVVGFASATVAPVGFGYFFQRDSRTLDIDGEWWYDNANSKLRVYSTANPSTHNYQITTVDTLFKNVGYNNVTINNLSFDGSGVVGILNEGCSNILINNCEVNHSGKEAITAWFATSVTVDSCTVNNSLGSGIYLRHTSAGDQNLTVTNCNVDSTIMFSGMDVSGSNMGRAGITVTGNKSDVLYNRITYSGYVALEWQGSDVNIKYNYINNYVSVRDDGGGIYTYETSGSTLPTRTNRNIISNIVLYGIGNANGTDGPHPTSARGIYCDEGTRNVLIDSNTIAYNNGTGLYNNSVSDITITNNVSFSNIRSHEFNRFNNAPLVRSIILKKNILYPYRFYYSNLTIDIPSVLTKQADISAMGTIDSNYYYLRTGTDTSLQSVTTYSAGTNYEAAYNVFSYLTATVGIETHSNRVNASDSASVLQYNASASPITYTFTGYSKKDIYGTTYNNSATIPAWGSVIFLANGTTTPPPSSSGNSTKWRKFRN